MSSFFDYGKEAEGKTASEPEKEHVAEQVKIKVSEKQVWDAKKNPDYKIVSLRDNASENGYGNVTLETSALTKEADGSYTVTLDKQREYGYSIKQNGEYVRKPLSGEQLAEQAEQKPAERVEYLNRVSTKLIHEGKNPDYKVVSIPFDGSENGFANLTVPSKSVFPTVNPTTKEVIPGRMNVRLGTSFQTINFSVKKDGTYVRETMQAKEFADQFREHQSSQVKQFREGLKQEQPEVSEPQMDDLSEEQVFY